MIQISNKKRIHFVAVLLAMVFASSCYTQSLVNNLSNGMVVDPSGKPILRAVVSVEYNGNRKKFTTDKNGVFRFNESAFTQGDLSVEANGYSKFSACLYEQWNNDPEGSFDYKFTLYPESAFPESLSGIGSLEGRISEISGNTFPGIIVQAEGTQIGTTCDSNGNYKIPNIPAGRYEFSCRIVGYSKTSIKPVTILPNFTTKINFIIFCWPSIDRDIAR